MAQDFLVRWHSSRKHRRTPPLAVYPAPPAGFFEGFHPGSGAVRANRAAFVVRHQTLPAHDVWTATTGIRRGATTSQNKITAGTTTGDFTHTVDSGASLLLLVVGVEGFEAITGKPTWNGSQDFTLISDSGSTGLNADVRLYVYGLVSPAEATATIAVSFTSPVDPAWLGAINYLGGDSTSVSAAVEAIITDVNTTGTGLTFLGNQTTDDGFVITGAFQGIDGSPATNNVSATEVFDTTTGTGDDFAVYFADRFADGEGTVKRITWSAVDQNTGQSLRLNAASDAPSAATPGAYLAKTALRRRDIRRQALRVPPLDRYRGTPTAGLTVAAYLERETLHRRDISRRLQTVPQHDVWTATPASALTEQVSRAVPFMVRTLPSRKLQPVIHTHITPAVIDYQPNQTGYFRRIRFRRTLIPVVAIPDPAATTPPIEQSGYPGSGPLQRFRYRSTYNIRTLDYPPVYPATAAPPEEPFGAWDNSSWHLQANKWLEVGQFLQQNHLGVYKLTDPAYYSGWYPGPFAPPKANVVSFRRKLQSVDLPRIAVTPPVITEPVTSWLEPATNRRHGKAKIVRLPVLDSYPRTIQSPAAYAPVPTIRTKQTARILKFVPQLDTFTEKPPPPPPEYSATVLNLAEFRKATQYRRIEPPEPSKPFVASTDELVCRYKVVAEKSGYTVSVELETYFVPAERDGYNVKTEPAGYTIRKCD